MAPARGKLRGHLHDTVRRRVIAGHRGVYRRIRDNVDQVIRSRARRSLFEIVHLLLDIEHGFIRSSGKSEGCREWHELIRMPRKNLPRIYDRYIDEGRRRILSKEIERVIEMSVQSNAATIAVRVFRDKIAPKRDEP